MLKPLNLAPFGFDPFNCKCEARKIYRGNKSLRNEIFNQSDSPTIHLDDELSTIVRSKLGEAGYAAYHFLNEPLYRWAEVASPFHIGSYGP